MVVAAFFVSLTPVAAIADEPPEARADSSSHLIISPEDAAGVATNLDMTPQELAEFASSNAPKTLIEDPVTGEILGIYSGIYSPDALASLDYELVIPDEVIESITLSGVDLTPPHESSISTHSLF
ncbi:MAG: hypothetical protein ACTH0C_10450 [Actinomycetaceae bacterium]